MAVADEHDHAVRCLGCTEGVGQVGSDPASTGHVSSCWVIAYPMPFGTRAQEVALWQWPQ